MGDYPPGLGDKPENGGALSHTFLVLVFDERLGLEGESTYDLRIRALILEVVWSPTLAKPQYSVGDWS